MNLHELAIFGGFIVFILLMLSLDLGVFNKKTHEITPKEAGVWTFVWVLLASSFYVLIRHYGEKIHGVNSMDQLIAISQQYKQPFHIIPTNFALSLSNYKKTLGLEFLTGYLVEESLSVDNIFVIILIFSSFGVKKQYYHKVLFWGILGALLFRFLFIFLGAFLISKFAWIIYIFALFLLFTGIKMLLAKEEDEESIDTEKHFIIRFASKYFRVHKKFEGENFIFNQNGKNYITPLLLVLLIIEFTDLLFAVDSIPAIFAVTRDPYIVFFSNVFAILGLRSIFFLLVDFIQKFHYFKTGLSALLIFIGLKMLLNHYLEAINFTTMHSLIVIVGILLLTVLASLIFPKKEVFIEK